MSTPDITAADYDAFVAMANRLGTDPLALARVCFAETGMYQRHPGNANIGVWPFIPSTLTRLGWTGSAADFTAQSFQQQIVPWFEKYLQPYRAYLKNAGLVYVANFLPARLPGALAASTAPDGGNSYVLTRRGDGTGYYESNTVLDRNGDGAITVGDLRQWLQTQDQGSRWATIESEIRARGGGWSEPGPLVSPAVARGLRAVAPGTVVAFTAGALGLWYFYATEEGARARVQAEHRIDSFFAQRKIAL